MKEVVSIEIAKFSPKTDRMSIKLDGVLRGMVDVGSNEWPLVSALLMLGFDSVSLVDERACESRFTEASLLRENPVHFDGPQPHSRGHVELRWRWSEPLEEYRIDVWLNGVRRPESVSARRSFNTMRQILVELGFTIGHVQEIAQAA
ncbi:hypothetical protein AB4Y45_32505 [Paraburkholderia sp. EG287A]|uniref:hypothetical protein n=1 Tax=Paraburkholderia sp. EG287A TaxID=3237012 RepID=UPI0034D2DDBC